MVRNHEIIKKIVLWDDLCYFDACHVPENTRELLRCFGGTKGVGGDQIRVDQWQDYGGSGEPPLQFDFVFL